MDERFGEWLRDALADIDDSVLKLRWGGVATLAEELNTDQIMDLLLYCANCNRYSAETLAKVRRTFWEHDSAFRMENNDVELRRLCGSVAMHVLGQESHDKLSIALATVCLHFGGLQEDTGLVALPIEAERVLKELSIGIRSSEAEQESRHRVITPSKALTTIKELIEQGNDHLPLTELEKILTQYGKGLNEINTANLRLQLALSIQKEETDILWWLMGAFSNDLQQPFVSLDPAVAAVVAGKELADHVRHEPGPVSVANILHRLVSQVADSSTAVPLSSAVVEFPMSWRKEVTGQADRRALQYCPLHAALLHSADLADAANWVTVFSNHFPHSPESEILPEVLGQQMYRERMLAVNMSARE